MRYGDAVHRVRADQVEAPGDFAPEPRAHIDQFSIDARAALKLKACVPCKQRGHYCEAETKVDGEPWCNACADGEPCRNDLIERARKSPSVTSKLPAERYRGVNIEGKRKKRRDSGRICDEPGCRRKLAPSNISGLCTEHDRRQPAEIEESEEEVLEEQRELAAFLAGHDVEEFGESASEAGNSAQAPAGDTGAAELRRGSPEHTDAAEEIAGWQAERDRYREKRKQQREERDMVTNTPTQPRYCKCKPGCTEIARSNASPYAKGHNPNLKKKASPAPTKPAAPRKNGSIETRVFPSEGVAMLCVTESHLNAYLLRLPLERKTVLVQRDLEEQLNA